jgi:hypothetical protein
MKIAWLLVGIVLFVAGYALGSYSNHPDVAAPASGATPSALWNYDEQVDPVTGKKTAKVTAQLHSQSSLDNSVITEATWDCSDGTTESLRLEMTTFLDVRDDQGRLKPVEQDERHPLDFRLDGVATSVEPGPFVYAAKREYENSVELYPLVKEGLYGRYRYKGLYTAKGRDYDGDFTYDTVAFYLVDPVFVARIPTRNGSNVVVQFSLEEPSIKRLLTQCGVTYGPPPPSAKSARKSN